jgi:SAM-dependent methyltransferase
MTMRIPWWAKISAKLMMSRLSLSYFTWSRLGIFRHGRMDDGGYARRVFAFHRSQIDALPEDATCLEIGPGDSLFTAISARQAGFARSILVDAGRYANDDLPLFVATARSSGVNSKTVDRWSSIDKALGDLNAVYLTDGLASLRSIPDNSVHLVFSQAVLEHVRKGEYADFVAEMKRVLVPGGIASHQVDLQDHLSGGLNNLRFPDSIWEKPLFSEAGFYTNRLSCSDHLRTFADAGFELRSVTRQTFERPPIKRRSLARQFSDRSDDDLAVLGFHLVAAA